MTNAKPVAGPLRYLPLGVRLIGWLVPTHKRHLSSRFSSGRFLSGTAVQSGS